MNLRHGIFANESVFETNTAAAGSFTVEMGILSRLTGERQSLLSPSVAHRQSTVALGVNCCAIKSPLRRL